MSEDFVQYLWRLQHFDRKGLVTTEGLELLVLHQGYYNGADSGPDFLHAKVKIGAIIWAGHVEVHTLSSDWRRHKHSQDAAYANVVLHVVWQDDEPLHNAEGQRIPTLELSRYADRGLEESYQSLMRNTHPILCNGYAESVPEILKLAMYDTALSSRMEEKVVAIQKIYTETGEDWTQTAQIWLFRHYGFRLNAEPMQRLGEVIPWKVLAWHRNELVQLEALLFGMAGLLPSSSADPYVRDLQQEFRFLADKFHLHEKVLRPGQWRMLRMRPANFPALRLAQLAAFLKEYSQLDSLLEAFPEIKKLNTCLGAPVSSYWQSHYHFAKKADHTPKSMGDKSRKIILTNVIVPLYFAFGRLRGDERFLDQALDYLRRLPAETNRITAEWERLGFPNRDAYDAQALLGLQGQFCNHRRCLHCKIGHHVLKNQHGN
jgi:hypothetical protein